MFIKISSFILFYNFLYHYFNFFVWYLGDNQIQIEIAFYKGLSAFLSVLLFILFIHLVFFPKKILDAPQIKTFPPLIMLFSINLGFGVGIYNLYISQLYSIPSLLNYLRSTELGIFLILTSFLLIYLSVKSFKFHQEDPNPITKSNKLITVGIFKYIRNPMYLSLILFQLGVGSLLSFLHISFFSLFTLFILHFFIIKKEESYLRDKFGKQYIMYMQTSRRWI
jgi:protein-S-isoprenylcysteine O-methyltransferase Ste14